MSTDFERDLSAWLGDESPSREPEGLADTVLDATARTRRLPGWASTHRWLPMEMRAQVGPTARAAILFATLALLTALTVSIIAVASQRQLPPPFGLAGNGLIAFDHEGDIWVVNPDGTGRRPLVHTDMVESDPAWANDGTRLAYWASEDGDADAGDAGNLVVVDDAGRDPVRIATDVLFPHGVVWSSDGDHIFFNAGIPGIVPARIHRAATDGSGSSQIGDPDLPAWGVAISPDGHTISFIGGRYDAEKGVYLMDSDGSNVRKLSRDRQQYWHIWEETHWTPDGQFVFATVAVGTRLGTKLFRVDGLHEIDITDRGTNVPQYGSYAAAVSPDGERMAYILERSAGRIVVSDPDGSDPLEIDAPNVDADYPLQWSPDGTRLLAAPAIKTNDEARGFVILDPTGEAPPVGIQAEGWWDWQRVAP